MYLAITAPEPHKNQFQHIEKTLNIIQRVNRVPEIQQNPDIASSEIQDASQDMPQIERNRCFLTKMRIKFARTPK